MSTPVQMTRQYIATGTSCTCPACGFGEQKWKMFSSPAGEWSCQPCSTEHVFVAHFCDLHKRSSAIAPACAITSAIASCWGLGELWCGNFPLLSSLELGAMSDLLDGIGSFAVATASFHPAGIPIGVGIQVVSYVSLAYRAVQWGGASGQSLSEWLYGEGEARTVYLPQGMTSTVLSSMAARQGQNTNATTQAVTAWLRQSGEYLSDKDDPTNAHLAVLTEIGPLVFNQTENKVTTQLGLIPYYNRQDGEWHEKLAKTTVALWNGDLAHRADWRPCATPSIKDVSNDFAKEVKTFCEEHGVNTHKKIINYKALEYWGYHRMLSEKSNSDAKYAVLLKGGTSGVKVLTASEPGLKSMFYSPSNGVVSIMDCGDEKGLLGRVLARKIAPGPGQMIGAALTLGNVSAGLRHRADVIAKSTNSFSSTTHVHGRRNPQFTRQHIYRMKRCVADLEKIWLTDENWEQIVMMFPEAIDFRSKKMTEQQFYELITKLVDKCVVYAEDSGRNSAAQQILSLVLKEGKLQIKPEMGLSKAIDKNKGAFSPTCNLCGGDLVKSNAKGKRCPCGGDKAKANELRKVSATPADNPKDGEDENKPRLIFNVGSLAQLLSIVPVGILELLYYSRARTGEPSDDAFEQKDKLNVEGYHNDCHIKHMSKAQAARHYIRRCQNMPEAAFTEGDGSSFDWTIGADILCFENGLLNSIAEWACGGAWHNFLPQAAYDALNVAHGEMRGQASSVIEGGTSEKRNTQCTGRIFMRIEYDLCRKSGDRGTSVLNHLVNWLLWGTLLCSDAVDMFRTETRDAWMRCGLTVSYTGVVNKYGGQPVKSVLSTAAKKHIASMLVGAIRDNPLNCPQTCKLKEAMEGHDTYDPTKPDSYMWVLRDMFEDEDVSLEILLRAIFEGDDSLLGHSLRLRILTPNGHTHAVLPRAVCSAIIKAAAEEWFEVAGLNMKIIPIYSNHRTVAAAKKADSTRRDADPSEVATFAGLNMLAHSTGLHQAAIPETIRGLNGVQWTTSTAILETVPGSAAEATIAYGAIMARVASCPAVGVGAALRAYYTACAEPYAFAGADKSDLKITDEIARKFDIKIGTTVDLTEFLRRSEEDSIAFDNADAVDRIVQLTAGAYSPEEIAKLSIASNLTRTSNVIPLLPRAWVSAMCSSELELM